MTQQIVDAIVSLISRTKIAADAVCVDYDPGAGSTYECSPKKAALEPFETILGRKIQDNELCGPGGRDYYTLRDVLVAEIRSKLSADAEVHANELVQTKA